MGRPLRRRRLLRLRNVSLRFDASSIPPLFLPYASFESEISPVVSDADLRLVHMLTFLYSSCCRPSFVVDLGSSSFDSSSEQAASGVGRLFL